MTNDELRDLYVASMATSLRLEAKYRMSGFLTRKERREFSEANRRIGVVAYESWLAAGKPDGPDFQIFTERGH